MDVNALNSTSTQTNPGKTKSNSLADFDQFLNLFVAQMRYQDPLSPVSGEDFLAQTAQFSSVEQLVGMNSQLEKMAGLAGSSNWSSAAALIGREVQASGIDPDGLPQQASGRVVRVDYSAVGEMLLGLEDGTTVPMSDVRSISEPNNQVEV